MGHFKYMIQRQTDLWQTTLSPSHHHPHLNVRVHCLFFSGSIDDFLYCLVGPKICYMFTIFWSFLCDISVWPYIVSSSAIVITCCTSGAWRHQTQRSASTPCYMTVSSSSSSSSWQPTPAAGVVSRGTWLSQHGGAVAVSRKRRQHTLHVYRWSTR